MTPSYRSPAVDIQALARRLPARPRTRFAPSPTGWLHLGHVVNAIYVWGLARALDGEVVLRIEDHDRTRCRPEYQRQLLEDLAWLGFHADDAHARGARPWCQSDHEDAYGEAIETLQRGGHPLFWCACSRRDIQAAAGHAVDGEVAYPMTCLARGLAPATGRGLRLELPGDTVRFDDARLGWQAQCPRTQCGALLLRDRDACWTYQLAVVVDDMRQAIDLVVRGEDLLPSTGRQIQLASLLGRPVPAVFLHHGLIRHGSGEKLSKSNRDTGIVDLRRAGWSPERVIGHAAWRVGLVADDAPVAADEVAALVAQR